MTFKQFLSESSAPKLAEEYDEHKLFQNVAKKLFNNVYQVVVAGAFTDENCSHRETNLSTLTVQEIMDKLNGHLAQEVSDINDLLFLRYLAAYPVSMCKRDISPLLSLIIGFHYRLSIPNEGQAKDGLEKISYEDLAEIFGRSKATISDCIKKTEGQWQEFQRQLKNSECERKDEKTDE
jgi:hypothetical protein